MPLTHAIVRPPSLRMADGLTTAGLGAPDPERARRQHDGYIRALQKCGLDVTVLPASDDFPDAAFVEDTAVIVGDGAVLTNPGAPSRQGEIDLIRDTITRSFDRVHAIAPPGTLDGGDVLQAGTHYFVGISERTNDAGARQLIDIVERFGGTGSVVPLTTMLHLKTGVSWLGENRILVAGELCDHEAFNRFEHVTVSPAEAYAANALCINGTVLLPKGFPETRERISNLGYPVRILDMSEFQKMDGGLSCLSLRYARR